MIYEMKLISDEFDNIKYNGKIIEVRINDYKRKLIDKGDIIKFNKISAVEESILVKVDQIFLYSSFQDVYESFPISCFGYSNTIIDYIIKNIYTIYTKEEEESVGVVAIKFNVLNQ